ncbi:MAG: tripartite tricarboxylate transporter TctB family protein [Candidatus Odyssella sp.]|nr:tripartite tricarboxylate transporter TctB family protein [Candidatus Odyssella sp.]
MRFHDSVIGLIAVMIGGFVLYQASAFQNFQSHQLAYGPGFFPSIVAMVLIAAGLVLTFSRLSSLRRAGWIEIEPWLRTPRLVLNAAAVLLSVVVYILAADAVGFLIVAPAILFVLLVLLWGRPAWALVIALATTFAIHQFFVVVLLVPLPWGIVPFFNLFR